MIRIGMWPTSKVKSQPILTYKCPDCGNEDIAMLSVKSCGECGNQIPDVDILYDDSMMRVYYYNYGESRPTTQS